MGYYSALKSKKILTFVKSCMTFWAKWNKPDRERQIPHSVTYMWNDKWTKKLAHRSSE